MAEQWIPASKAFEIVGSELTLTNLLRSGLLKAKAGLIGSSVDEYVRNPIRSDFWQTDRYHDFKADWQAGYCSNVFDGTIEVYVSGLTIELSGLLQTVPAEERGVLARSFSVAGDNEWLSALEARRLCFSVVNPASASSWLLEQARLGFVTARAVKAEMKRERYDQYCIWAEREWDIPVWFWENFTKPSSSVQSWETGQFSGRGRSPDTNGELILSGIHFHAKTLRLLTGDIDGTTFSDHYLIASVPARAWPVGTWRIRTKAAFRAIRGALQPVTTSHAQLLLHVPCSPLHG